MAAMAVVVVNVEVVVPVVLPLMSLNYQVGEGEVTLEAMGGEGAGAEQGRGGVGYVCRKPAVTPLANPLTDTPDCHHYTCDRGGGMRHVRESSPIRSSSNT